MGKKYIIVLMSHNPIGFIDSHTNDESLDHPTLPFGAQNENKLQHLSGT